MLGSLVYVFGGVLIGAIIMAFFYYRNKQKMDALVKKANEEISELREKVSK